MLKVLIADDEQLICSMINKMIDWEGRGLALAGMANNGLDVLTQIRELHPDIVITTHSFATELICSLKVSEKLTFPVISIMTDFAIHQTYINKGVNAYILSSEEMAEQMLKRGVSKEKVYNFGIPVKKRIPQKNRQAGSF